MKIALGEQRNTIKLQVEMKIKDEAEIAKLKQAVQDKNTELLNAFASSAAFKESLAFAKNFLQK